MKQASVAVQNFEICFVRNEIRRLLSREIQVWVLDGGIVAGVHREQLHQVDGCILSMYPESSYSHGAVLIIS